MDYLVRDYHSGDYDKLILLWEETGVSNPARGDDQQMIEKTLNHGGKLLLMFNSDQLVGSSWITNDGRRLYLHHFAIAIKYQGLGLSKPLLDDSLKWAEKLGLQIKLEVHRNNEIATHLYKKHRFKYLGDYLIYIIRNYNQ